MQKSYRVDKVAARSLSKLAGCKSFRDAGDLRSCQAVFVSVYELKYSSLLPEACSIAAFVTQNGVAGCTLRGNKARLASEETAALRARARC